LTCPCRWRHAGGFTLTELLVTLSLLALLFGLLTPVAGGLLERAQGQNTATILKFSWQNAHAYALATGQPVVWQLRQNGKATEVCVCVTREAADPLWITSLRDCQITDASGAVLSGSQTWQVLVPPQGLTDSVEITGQAQGSFKITLPGVIDAR
jgi:prepilin-type N-terminal cleavage/methylation domain-containing protein